MSHGQADERLTEDSLAQYTTAELAELVAIKLAADAARAAAMPYDSRGESSERTHN